GNTVGALNAAETSGGLSFTNSGPLTVSGVNVGGGDATIDASGAMQVTGLVTASSGNVFITAAGGVTINAGVTAGGGVARFFSPVTVGSNETVTGAPVSFESLAIGLHTLTVAGGADLGSASTFSASAAGATAPGVDYSQLAVPSGSVMLNDITLNLNVTYSPSVGDALTIVSDPGGTISFTFRGLADGARFDAGRIDWQIHYTAHTVTLTVVAVGVSQSSGRTPQPRGQVNQSPPNPPGIR
ncbi:MAG TPA: hypothetical protein VNU19_01325, partial [Candidatus Acidoferrum sp.]|nr:hypothetical protein [Candidatus Acidoferrum sp.]